MRLQSKVGTSARQSQSQAQHSANQGRGTGIRPSWTTVSAPRGREGPETRGITVVGLAKSVGGSSATLVLALVLAVGASFFPGEVSFWWLGRRSAFVASEDPLPT